MVCASNLNRSMAAHELLKSHSFNVGSFGVGGQVKLPGATQSTPNAYSFGTPYVEIYKDLYRKDPELYQRNGLLNMVKRNSTVKLAPEKFQENLVPYDIVVTFEERVMDQVIEDLNKRPQGRLLPVLVINLDIKDSHEEAGLAAPHVLKLCNMLEAAEEWEDEIEDIVNRLSIETGRKAIYTICFF